MSVADEGWSLDDAAEFLKNSGYKPSAGEIEEARIKKERAARKEQEKEERKRKAFERDLKKKMASNTPTPAKDQDDIDAAMNKYKRLFSTYFPSQAPSPPDDDEEDEDKTEEIRLDPNDQDSAFFKLPCLLLNGVLTTPAEAAEIGLVKGDVITVELNGGNLWGMTSYVLAVGSVYTDYPRPPFKRCLRITVVESK